MVLLGAGTWVIASCPSGTAPGNSTLSLPTSVWVGGIGGVGGAFFSIALGTMQRTLATSLNPRDNLADAALRVIVGLIGAWVLVLMHRAKLIPDFSIGGTTLVSGTNPIELTLLLGFVAEFLERLVPDLLARKAEEKVDQAKEKTKQAEDSAKQTVEQSKQADANKSATGEAASH